MHRRSALLALTAVVYASTLGTVLARGAGLTTVLFGTLIFGAVALGIAKLF
jgi:hypothetical protein